MASLRADPLDAKAAVLAAASLERSGRAIAAARAWELAGRLGRRDIEAQAHLLRSAAQAGDWVRAAQSADAILRSDGAGAMRASVFPFLDLMAADPAARPALVASLAGSPPWRMGYLQGLDAPGRTLDEATARTLLEALARAGSPPGASEYAPRLASLLDQGRPGDALAFWRQIATRPDRDLMLRDPTFERGADGGPFTWREAAGVGAESRTDAPPEGVPGKALVVDYDGFSAAQLPAQLVVLAPGSWRLAWRERAQGAWRMAWQVRCLGGASPLAREAPAQGDGWTSRSLDVAIPDVGCPAAWIELTPLPGERRTEATLASADFTLRPVARG